MKIRNKKFSSLPYFDKQTINAVVNKIKKREFSKFSGSPDKETRKHLGVDSLNLPKLITSERSFFGGKSILTLEKNWSNYCKAKYTISVNSATSALTTAIMACDIGPGDEIICSPFTFTASVASIVAANAIPKFCDISLNTFCLDPINVESLITKKTKAIMAIHWNSNAGDLNKIKKICKKNKLILIEDASQCHGMDYENKKLGTIGDVGIFSLNEPKNIMVGEGGLIVTNQKKIAVKSRLIRNHGENIVNDSDSNKEISNIIGYNFRLSEIHAEIGIYQIKKLSYLNKIRKKNYLFLRKNLKKFEKFLAPQKITTQNYCPYTIGFRFLNSKNYKRKDFVSFLEENNIPVSTGVGRLISDHPMFKRQIAYGSGQCPFSCHLYKAKYTIPEMPNAQKLNQEQYIGFFQIGWPNKIKDMKDIIKGFELFFKI
jgi:perosamine synthetase